LGRPAYKIGELGTLRSRYILGWFHRVCKGEGSQVAKTGGVLTSGRGGDAIGGDGGPQGGSGGTRSGGAGVGNQNAGSLCGNVTGREQSGREGAVLEKEI